MVLDELCEHGRSVAPDRADEVEPFLQCYYRHVDPADLRARRVEDLVGAAVEHVRLARSWEPGTARVEVLNPSLDTHGWTSDHTVVMVVVDDMAFLVDSVVMALNRHDLGIHLVVHPILLDRRESADAFVDAGTDPAAGAGGVSFIYVEVDRQTDPEVLDRLRDDLLRVLADVRAANEDWKAMRQRAVDIADSLATEPNPTSEENTAEVRALLEWLAADHFSFLGYREYELTEVDGEEVLRIVPGTGLGILRETEGTTRSRSFSQLPASARARAREPLLLNLTKANSVATIHRAVPLDYIGVKTFAEDGTVTGERRFLGLYTNAVYNRSVTEIPFVRRKVRTVVERSGFPAGAHAEKDLLAVLENYPRAELFQIDSDQLFEIAMSVVKLNERRRVRLFVRLDPFGRFVTCILFLPRDRYSTEVRLAVQDVLDDAFDGHVVDWSSRVSESVLARLFFVVRTDPEKVPEVDITDLEARLGRIVQNWDDSLREELVSALGEDLGLLRHGEWGAAFPPGYRAAFSPRQAIADIERLAVLEPDALDIAVYREQGQPDGRFKVKFFRRGEPLSLTSIMPTLVNAGVTVYDERPFNLVMPDGEQAWMYDFHLGANVGTIGFERLASLFEELVEGVWRGDVEDDAYNELSLVAGLPTSEVRILRALSRYLRQVGIQFSERYLQTTLVSQPDIARSIVELFLARFDPERDDADRFVPDRVAALSAAIDEVVSLDQDRILRRFANLVMAATRTNYFQHDADGHRRPFLAFKFDPRAVDDLPRPRPHFEIYAFSSRFEGVHLRAGPVARGGLRWSDRMEDFRTEVLGLVKAQMVKNAVIVPAGAKGGFVVKRPPAGDRTALLEEVEACYRLFISAMLDLTDNLVAGEIVPPPDTLRYDGDDPYLVVAADKGTATFSDTANAISLEKGFWLGDAFASGGAHGYDHKAMGITARGAWESVKRHFRELGRDVQTEPFTAVGIGDMSGDVFGNGMLLSPQLRLVAAFDHRHIFVDPDPDPATSYAERARLFALPRSSWADYNDDLLSPGGGIYSRGEKEIELGEAAAEALGVEAGQFTPNELIRAVLKAPVDLLWNGGIGTYVKASDEADLDVGDKANEGVRVDGRDLRCLVVGEGGNLGLTQRGRVEFAQGGGRVFTDAIDNSAGVECSDQEVNIKILLNQVVAAGDLTDKQRNQLLEEMTDEVAEQVIADNYSQSQAIAQARRNAPGMVDVHARYLTALEHEGLLDRQLEFLPDAEEMADRRAAGQGLTTPELAVVLAYTKNRLSSRLLASTVPDDPFFEDELQRYFPKAIRDRFASEVAQHPLRREIVASRITNAVVDRGGTTMLYRLGEETGIPAAEIARAHMVAWEILDLQTLWQQVATLDAVVDADTQVSILLGARRLAERATRWLLRNRHTPIHATATYEELAPGTTEVLENLDDLLVGADLRTYRDTVRARNDHGVPPELSQRAAALDPAVNAFDIVDIARDLSAPVLDVAGVHFALAHRLDLIWLRERILALPRDQRWSTLARLTLRGDLYLAHRQLTHQVCATRGDDGAKKRVDQWMTTHADAVGRYERVLSEVRSLGSADVTTLLVVSREVRNLIHRAAGEPDDEDD